MRPRGPFSRPLEDDPISYTYIVRTPAYTPPPRHRHRSPLSTTTPRHREPLSVSLIPYLSAHNITRYSVPAAARPLQSLRPFRSRAKSVCGLSVQKTTAKFSYRRASQIYIYIHILPLPIYSKLRRRRC